MSWKAAGDAWQAFLAEVAKARVKVHATFGVAWFRGHANADEYYLRPTLYRSPNLTPVDGMLPLPVLEAELDALRAQYRHLIDLKTKEKQLINRSGRGKPAPAGLLFSSDPANRARLNSLKSEIPKAKSKLEAYQACYPGERDAYVEWTFRSGGTHTSSWQTLAEMQHHGVPTRLLDWTEVLSVATYFALSHYARELNAFWRRELSKSARSVRGYSSGSRMTELPYMEPKGLAEPSVWVLNPFLASKQASGETRIWDFTQERDRDYFQRVVVNRDWPYTKPVPMFSPWRHPRLAAQQAMFTVFGAETRPLNKQISADAIEEVRIPAPAAI